MTEKAQYRLTLKEHQDGRPFFLLEARDRELSIVDPRGWIGIELRPEVDYEDAAALRKTLDDYIEGLSYTVLPESVVLPPPITPSEGHE